MIAAIFIIIPVGSGHYDNLLWTHRNLATLLVMTEIFYFVYYYLQL
jgi:hypothetical protein